MARRRTRKSTGTTKSRSTTYRSRTRKTSSSVRPTGKYYLTDSVIDAIVAEVYDRLALADIGLRVEELREILQPVIEKIAEQYSSRPSKEQIIARLFRSQDKLLELISAYLVETRDELTEAQLEFIVYNGGVPIARYAPKLYPLLKRINRDDLIDVLRSRWVESGLSTPFVCPRCGFYALTPDLHCIVCGADIDEKEFKEFIGFDSLLRDFAESSSASVLKEVIVEKRIAFDGATLKPVSEADVRRDVILYLDERDIKLLKSFVERKRE